MMRTKMCMTAFVVGALIQTTVAPPLVEANLWTERRARSVRQRSLPERSERLHVAALPTPHQIKLASPDSVDARSVGNPLGFSLPLECGSVRKIMPPRASPSSRVVIHILDVHHNEAAQRKIGRAIESLVSNGSIGLVALEGAYGPIEIGGVRRFSRPDFLRTAADYLLRVHDISGPVHSAITGNQAFPPIVGVDDPAHYRANVTAYQRAGPRQGDVQEALNRVQTDLDRRCAAGMNQPLLTFVRLTQSFHNEITPLGTYLRALLSGGPKKAVGSSLVWFQEALDLEGRLDFKQVEREREALLGVLLRRLNAGEIEKLTQNSTAYRLGKIRYSEFYRDLGALCAQNGVDLHRFPHMEMYIRYVLMADKIDPEKLFTDLRILENAILARRIKSLSERRLVEETTVLTLAKKLTAFSLTTEEWNQYASSGKDFLSQEGLNLQDFEAFYQEAQARDTAMADNLLREMENNPSKPAVLVTGGFHSSGLTDRLTRAGVTVVRFTPRIEKIDTAQGSAYLSVFSQEKTPLESLFQGQKLFLATSPANVEKLSFLAAITGAAKEKDPSARKRIFAHLYSEAAGLLGFNDIKRALPEMKVIESAGQRKTLRVHWKGKSYEVSFANDKIVDFHPGSTTSDNMWRPVIAFLKKLAGMILRWIPLAVVADHENGLPNVDLTESGRPGFAKEKLLSSFYGTRDKLIKRGRPDGKPYFPYLYESRDREVGIEADGIKIVLVDVAERADYDKPRRLSEFARHPRDIRGGHPDDKCVFCGLMGANSDEFFARVQGTGRNEYRATVNLGEYGYPHFQFISENPVPNLYDRDNRLMDFLLSAQALGPELGVMINGPFSGASQRHLHWHAIKIKPGGLWAYIDSLSPPTESGPSMREELANYPGRPILFRGSSLEELNEKITKEITALYDDQISAGVHARVRTDGTFEVVVAPTRGEAMVAFDVILHGSDEEFERHRTAVRNYNLFGILDPTFEPIAEGMGATHTPGSAPNILMKLPEDFKANNEWQARTANRLLQVFGDYNPKIFPSETHLHGTEEDAYPESRDRLELVYRSFRPDLGQKELESSPGDALVVAQFVAGQKGAALFNGGEDLTQKLEAVVDGVRKILRSHVLVEGDYVDLYERHVFHSSLFVLRRTSDKIATPDDIAAAQRLAEGAFNNSTPYGLVYEMTVINNNTLVAIGFVDGTPRTPSLARDYFANRPEDGYEKKRSAIFGISLGRFKKPLPPEVLNEIESYLKTQGSHERPLGRVWVDKVAVFTHRGPNFHQTPLHVHAVIPLGSSGGVNTEPGSSIYPGVAKTGLVAVDIGGTSIVAAVMDREGNAVVSERIDTVKLKPGDFFQRVAELILRVKRKAEGSGYGVSSQVGVGSPGRFVSGSGGRVIAGTSAPNLGPDPDSFKGANPEVLLTEKLPGLTVVVHNDAVAQMAGQLDQLLADPNNAGLKGTTVAYIGPGTGLGGGFGVIDVQGHCSYPTDGHIYDLVISREGVNLPLTVADQTIHVKLGGMAEDVLSGRAVIEIIKKANTALSDRGLPAVFPSVDKPDGRTLNDVLSGGETDSNEYSIARQIAQFEGQMLGRVMELIHLGHIEKWTADSEWSEADKGQVKGIVNFLLGGSVPQGSLGQIMRQTALEHLAQNQPGVAFHIINPVIDGKEAGLRGAASFVKPLPPVPMKSSLAQTPFTRRMWNKLKHLFPEDWQNSLAVEARFTGIWEFALHWLSPSLIAYVAGMTLAGAGYGVSPEVLVSLFFPIQAEFFYKSHGIRGPPPLRVIGFLMVINWVGTLALLSGGWLALHGVALMALGIIWHSQYDEELFKQNRTSQGLTTEELARVRVLIPAGGKGSRLYPVGDKLTAPHLGDDKTLLESTIGRMTADLGNGLSIHPNQVYVVGSSQRPRGHGDVATVPEGNILNAPAGTPLPDLLWALAHLKRNDPDATVVVGQGDNYFGNPADFNRALEQAIAVARSHHGIIEMGIVPRAVTFDEERRMGHGYYALSEKSLGEMTFPITWWEPKAEEIPPHLNLSSIGRYICTGVFVGNIGAFEKALKAVYPDQYELYAEMLRAVKKGEKEKAKSLAEKFPKTIPSPVEGQDSIENSYAYLHRAMVNANVPEIEKFVVLANFPWADLGVWKNFRSLPSHDSKGNVVLGNSQAGTSSQCIFYAGSSFSIDADALEGMLVAVDGGRVLVTTVDSSARMGDIVGALERDPEFLQSLDEQSPGSLITAGRAKLLNSPGCRVYAGDAASVVLYGVHNVDVDVIQGHVFVRPRNDLWPDVLAQKYRLVRSLYSGTNPDHVFLVEDRSGQLRVIKYVDKPGIDGNGMPFIANQIRRLLYLKKEIPQELNRFYPEVLDHAITEKYVYYVMPYFEGSEPPLMSFWEGKLSLDEFHEQMTGLVRYLFSKIYNQVIIPNQDPSLIHFQHLNRMDRRFKDLLRREGDAYRLHHANNQMNVAGTEYSDSTQLFERLFAQPTIAINGKRCLNSGQLRQLLLARPNLLHALNPTRLSVFHHGDLSPGNVLRKPDGSLVIVDHRGTVRVDEPYDPVYDLAKIPYYYLVLAVRQGALHATGKTVNGLLEFEFPSREQDKKVRDVWAARARIIHSFHTTPEVLKFFENGQDHHWDSRLLLAEAANMISTTADMFWVDRRGDQALDVYLLGVYLLNLWAEREGLIVDSGREPPVVLKNLNDLNRGVLAVQVQPGKLVVTLVGRDDLGKLTHAKLRREIIIGPLTPAELFDTVARHAKELRDLAVRKGWDMGPLVGVTCPGSFVSREGRTVIDPGSAPNLGPTPTSYDGVNPVEELSQRLPGFHVVVANDSKTQLAFAVSQLGPRIPAGTERIAFLDVRTGLGSAFVRLGEKGATSITQSQIHNMRVDSAVIAPTIRLGEDLVPVPLGTNAEDVFSGRAVASFMKAVDQALVTKGRAPLFSPLGNPGIYLANEIILGHMGDELAQAVAAQIFQFEGDMLAKIIQRLHRGAIQGDPATFSWTEADRLAVAGIETYVVTGTHLGGSALTMLLSTTRDLLSKEGVLCHLIPLESHPMTNDLAAASLTEQPFPRNSHRDGVERLFGRTGLSFLPMGLGTIWFGRRWPNNNQAWTDPSQTEVDQAIWRAFEQLSNKDGRVMIDTAAAYGKSEERIGDFFHRYPAYARLAFIATKWGEEHHLSTGQSQYDHSAESLRTSFERSLARLGRVDLLYVHGTPGQIVDEEAKKAMMALRTSGKVKLLGVSLSHRHPKARDTILLQDWEGVFDVVQMPANMFIENREFVQALKARGIAIVLNSALPAHPELLHNSDVSMILNGSRFHFDENASLLNQPSLPKSGALAQTPLTKSVWKNVARLFKVSPRYKYSKHVEFAFTALWEFFLHWAAPFFVVSWLFAHFGLSFPDMWLIPVLAVILEPVFVGSHPFSVQGKDLTRLAHFLMSFYGAGGFLIAWGGRGPALGVVFIIVGLAVHFFHDFFRAPPSSSDEENIERKNANEVTNHPETVLRSVLARKIESTDLLRRQGLEHSVHHSIDGGPVPAGESRLSLPEPVDAQLRNATARFAFLAGLDEVAVRDRSAVKSKHTLLSLLDAYAKAGEGWKGNLSQVVNDENAGVWVVPVGSDWKSMGALARACLSSRGRHTEIRFIAENEAVALALRFWSLGRGRVKVRTVPKAFSPGSGNHRIVRLFAVQQSLARDVVLRSGTAWRIVAPDSIAMDYSGLAENSPLWNAPVVFLDALLRALPVPASSLRNLDSAASRLIKRMA